MPRLQCLASYAAILLAAALCSACGQARVVRVEQPREYGSQPAQSTPAAPPARAPRPSQQPIPASREHVVVAGETLYAISMRYGLDYREIADWNAMGEPYTLRIGQRLRLDAPRVAAAPPVVATAPAAKPPTPTPSVTPFETVPDKPATTTASASPVVANPPPSGDKPPVATPSPAISSATPSPAASTAAPSPVVATPVVAAPATADNPSKPVVVSPPATTTVPAPLNPSVPIPAPTVPATGGSALEWRWPTQGQVIGRYVNGDPTQQGINIGGKAGQPVLAAGDGVVVYSGAGLVGYGELIIIKHSNEWLSAYAHNRRRLVAEGTKVKAGETIAEMGRTGAIRDMLHFEIRRNGKPVDPLQYLPAR